MAYFSCSFPFVMHAREIASSSSSFGLGRTSLILSITDRVNIVILYREVNVPGGFCLFIFAGGFCAWEDFLPGDKRAESPKYFITLK